MHQKSRRRSPEVSDFQYSSQSGLTRESCGMDYSTLLGLAQSWMPLAKLAAMAMKEPAAR